MSQVFQVDNFDVNAFQATTPSALNIWITSGGAYTDYSNWLFNLPVKTHSLNQPQTLEFSLTNGVPGLVVPEAGNRVQWATVAYDVTFSGYMLNTPELELLGANNTGAGVYGYKIRCTDESVRLEWNRSAIFPTLQPFVNQFQGQIVKGLIAALGGGFTTTNIDNGILVPYFRVKPEESFWDAVRRLSDRTNMKLWFLNGAANYKSYGDLAFSPAPNESDSFFNPYLLNVTPVDNPVFNDVTGIGDPEPQTFVREHFIGDGVTATFPLKMTPFGTQSGLLQVDDWTEVAIDANRWTKTDVNSLISLNSGSLKFAGGPVATGSRLTAVQGLEIAGKIEIRSGRFRFTGANNAILGGLFTADTGALADCVAGFRATPSGVNTVLQPIVSGVSAGPTYQVVSGKSYNLVIVVDCSQAVRRRRPFFSLASSFGGENVTADARISFYVLEIVDGAPDSLTNTANTVISYTATIANIQQFLFFTVLSGPMNTIDSVNMVVNFTYIHTPVQCEVWTRKSGATSWTRERLGDKAQPDIRVSVNATQQAAQVIFVAGQELAQSERVRVIYRGAGLARARVKKATSITAEAAKAGDTGIRAGILPSLQPIARDTSELERQIQAYIDDATVPLFRGTWQFDSKLYSVGSIPVPGRIITVTAPTRYAAFTALVTDVTQTLEAFDKDGVTEIFSFQITFGPLSRLQDEQENFLPAEDAMSGPLDSVTPLIATDTVNIGTVFAADVPEADFDLTVTPTTLEIDAGMSPTSSFDVRKTDSAWGSVSTINQISTPATRIFTVTRNSRDVSVYLKNKDVPGNLSRYPALVRVVYPMPPNTPLATFDYSNVLNIKLKIDPAILTDINAFGFEIRAKDNVTVLRSYGYLILTDADLTINLTDIVKLSSKDTLAKAGFGADAFLVTRALDFYVYAWNLLGEYSPAFHLTATIPTPTVSGLSVDEANGKLVWIASYSTAFKVEVATDAGYATIILTKIISDPFLALDDENTLRQRYFRVTPRDAIGWGTAVTTSHSHIPATPVDAIGGVAINNTDNTYSIPAIPTPTTDITPDSAFNLWADDIKDRSRRRYFLNRQ